MDWNLAIAAISMVAGVAAAYFAYVAVRGHVRRRPKTTPIRREPGGPYDVFISYADADVGKAEWLADGLRTRGLRVFLAKWVGVGLVEYAEKERALADSANGVLLFSSTTMSRPDIRDEYAALLQHVHSGARRFVPVLVEKTDLPPFARIRKPLDLADNNNSQAALDELARAIKRKYSEIVWLLMSRIASTSTNADSLTGLPNTYDQAACLDSTEMGDARAVAGTAAITDAVGARRLRVITGQQPHPMFSVGCPGPPTW